MTKTISDLPEDLVVEILSRVPMNSLRSLRSTCKKWNALSKNWIFGKKAEAKNQFLGFMIKSNQICSVRIDLQGTNKDDDDSIHLSIKHIQKEVKVYKAYHCDGLVLLWILNSTPRLMVWNPYLGQRRLISPLSNSISNFALGYDNNGNHKILHILDFNQQRYVKSHNPFYGYNIYEIRSGSWRVLDLTPNGKIPTDSLGVTLKGNAYFYAKEEKRIYWGRMKHFLLCFDFTTERFGPRLTLPFDCYYYTCDKVILSLVRDEQLAVLYQPWRTRETMEIWVTNQIYYNEVLWTKWMKVDQNLIVDFPMNPFRESFFIHEEKKVVVVFDQFRRNLHRFDQTAHIVGQDGYFKPISIGEYEYPVKPDLFRYSPSLVQIQ